MSTAPTGHCQEQNSIRVRIQLRTLATCFEERLAGVKPPATVEEQLALLRDRERPSDAALADLARRRLAATRERLVTVEGIPAERLRVAEARADAPNAEVAGRVEFTVVAGAE